MGTREMARNPLVEQLESSVEFLEHRLRIERDATELAKLRKELAQAKGQLSAASLRAA